MARCPFAQWSTIYLHSIHQSNLPTLHCALLLYAGLLPRARLLHWIRLPARINNVIALLWHLPHETSNYLHLFAPGCGAAVIATGLYGWWGLRRCVISHHSRPSKCKPPLEVDFCQKIEKPSSNKTLHCRHNLIAIITQRVCGQLCSAGNSLVYTAKQI